MNYRNKDDIIEIKSSNENSLQDVIKLNNCGKNLVSNKNKIILSNNIIL